MLIILFLYSFLCFNKINLNEYDFNLNELTIIKNGIFYYRININKLDFNNIIGINI